eukprot:503574-Pleurochrysis_carterae.AAC.3
MAIISARYTSQLGALVDEPWPWLVYVTAHHSVCSGRSFCPATDSSGPLPTVPAHSPSTRPQWRECVCDFDRLTDRASVLAHS